MKILIIGAGVIGTIYGQLFSEAGHQVFHYVRPGKSAYYTSGIQLHLLDGRGAHPQQRDIHYPTQTVEHFVPKDYYDLIMVSVRHYQLASILPMLAANAGNTSIIFFNALWTDFGPINQYLSRRQYLWGYPVAGGALTGKTLDGALLSEVRLGETDGRRTERLERYSRLFESAHLKVDVQDNILHWLWFHFAQEAAVIGVGLKVGSAEKLMTDVGALHEVILCMRETWKICEARGVYLKDYAQESNMFYWPSWMSASLFRLYFRTHALERRIMTAHTGVEELQQIYNDVLAEGQRLHINMPHFAALNPYVTPEEPIIVPAA